MAWPKLTGYARSRDSAVALQGMNLGDTLLDGEWSWTQNMDASAAPVVQRRKKRIKVAHLIKPNGMIGTDKLAFVDGVKFYYDGYYYGDVADSEKTMVAMGANLCIFPDKVIFDTLTHSFSPMEQTNVTDGTVTITLAKADGTAYAGYTASGTAPETPANGALWMDTSGDAPVMKAWSEASGMWVEETTTCVQIAATGIGVGIKADDGVTVSGVAEDALNGDWIISGAENDSIIFTGIISATATQTAAVTVKRVCPDMDFVIEHNNRLWGCSSLEHELYACALGDATNWRRYAGISTDSYAVTVGSPGDFTGAAVINSSVVFAKENCLHKIYGTMPSNFQSTVANLRGVEKGSGKALVRLNELLYYKSAFDVCVYDADAVQSVSSALGEEKYSCAVAGVNDRKLYMSMKDAAGKWHLLTLDTVSGYWMREDETQALAFANVLTETFMLDANGDIWALQPGAYAKDYYMAGSDYTVYATEETDAQAPWEAVTGEMMQSMPDNKHIGRIQILMELEEGATATVSIKKDNEPWMEAATLTGDGRRRYTLPIYPKRCDRLKIKCAGVGGVKILNMSRLIASGSEYGR